MRTRIVLHTRLTLLMIMSMTASCTVIFSQSAADTVIRIPDVEIKASRYQQFGNDIKTDEYHQDELSPFSGESLGRFLISKTALNVRSYGVGGALSNISLRGSSTSQVQVNWNGFPVNSVTLGSCDFSLIPVDGFDNISVVYGAPGALYGSGTFGGAVNLNNDLKTADKFKGSVNAGYESLKTINGSVSITLGTGKLAWKINAWGALSGNEFNYYDYIGQTERKQTDGQWTNAGAIQQFMFRLSSTSTIEAGLWYQVKAFNIPSRIGSVSYEFQRDSTLKFHTGYKKSGNRWNLEAKAAVFTDHQRYAQKASAQSSSYSIDSRIKSNQIYGDINFRYHPAPSLSVDAGLIGSFINASVTAYGQRKEEKGLTAFTGFKYDKNRLSVQAEFRKEWNSNFSSGLLSSFGIARQMKPDKWRLRFNVSQKFRKPTFNDLFWMPGGNLGLKPETGYSVETGSTVTIFDKGNARLSADAGIYWSEINNMIVWRPDGAYWSAMNYQRVHSAGVDGKLILDVKHRRLKYLSTLNLMLNKSDIKTYVSGEHEKMLYSPRIITVWENNLSAGIFDLVICHRFTADRFYDDNSLLNPYQILDIRTGVRIPAGKGKLGIHPGVYNLTNTTYELIRLFPMPGRYWSVKINYSF
ncbi:MAG TPA: TonB-dependent receptor plug domain-containing protein [Bacteroidales bacterium]|nr:TonB-dependent receptor plug domain-containing protein [Bacteroidales bacterium]HNR43280.1 TonB-dependent receptor plug domain-containing protein [Bacteroidales bacterium]HPM19526.1 TonB-dependent receptor plug domain-containing protein [Bacteroidales bacterium]